MEALRPTRVSVLDQTEDGHSLLNDMNTIHDILSSSYGPRSSIKMIMVNGNVEMTSFTKGIIRFLPIDCQRTEIIKSSLMNVVVEEATKMLGIVATKLVSGCVLNDLHPYLVSCLFRTFLSYLELDSGLFQFRFNLASSSNLISIIESVLATKPLANLTENSQLFMTTLIIKAFMVTLPADSIDHIHVKTVTIDTSDVYKSCVHEGFMLELYLEDGDTRMEPRSRTFVAFSCSLAGEVDDFSDGGTLDGFNKEDAEQYLLCRAKSWVELKVGIVFCQKRVHDCVKLFLRRSGVAVFERLGTLGIDFLVSATGCQVLCDCRVEPSLLSLVEKLDFVSISGKDYAVIDGEKSKTATIVVANWCEFAADEVSKAIAVVMDLLRLLVCHPAVVPGGGCWESVLISKLAYCVLKDREDICRAERSSTYQLYQCMSVFVNALLSPVTSLYRDTPVYTDAKFGHCWLEGRPRCQCGSVSDSVALERNLLVSFSPARCPALLPADPEASLTVPTLCDVRVTKVTNLFLAVDCAVSVLSVGCCIGEKL